MARTVTFTTVPEGEPVGSVTFGPDGLTGDETAVAIATGVWVQAGRDPETAYTYYRSWSNGYLRSQSA